MSTYEIEVPAQGVSLSLDEKEAVKFFDGEIGFYRKLQALLSTAVITNNTNHGESGIYQKAISTIDTIRKEMVDGKAESESLKRYLQAAQELRLVVGQGEIGKRVEGLLETSSSDEARWSMLIFSAEWTNDQVTKGVAELRAAALAHPALRAYSDLRMAAHARQVSDAAMKRSVKGNAEVEKVIREKQALFADLEALYRQKLVLEEPANYWKGVAEAKTKAWSIWLVVFAVLVAVPIGLVLWNWAPFAKGIAEMTTTSGGVISVTGLAAVTVPALFYAWLLKSVSRLFIQNLALADDAAHRRALAITFLGLAENRKLSMADQDRALILNALFRPTPNQSADEGPPSGLMDLIKSKTNS